MLFTVNFSSVAEALPLEFPWLVAAPPGSYYRALALVQHEDERIGCESGVAALPTVVFAANR